MQYEFVEGGITAPEGFVAGGVFGGIKTYGPEPRLDVGLLASTEPCAVAGVFTKNRVCGAAVDWCRERVAGGVTRGIAVNSGCSNVAMGERGHRDARRMAALGGGRLGVPAEELLVASTGVIGRPLPMEKIEAALANIPLSRDGGAAFSRAIMTTDTRPKERAARVTVGGVTYTVGGTAKGSGMVHPDMATVFCFLTTDAPVELEWLRSTLRAVADVSINMVDVDMDTSTSDTMLLFASGKAGGEPVRDGHPAAPLLKQAIEAVAIELARDLARDGEGAKTLIEVRVRGAASVEDARRVARTVSSSPLVKTMVTGRDPNLGRVMAAAGRAGAEIDVNKTSVWLGEHCVFERGEPTTVPYDAIAKALDREEVVLALDLGLGEGAATAWGCDLTEEYVRINASYTT